MEDSEIVELYWRRDESAIRETEKKYGALCRGVARSILNTAEDAEEVMVSAETLCVDTKYVLEETERKRKHMSGPPKSWQSGPICKCSQEQQRGFHL